MSKFNIDIPDPIPEELRKSLELSQRLRDAVQPALEQQQRIREIVESATQAMPKFEIENPAIEAAKQMQFLSPLAQMAKQLPYYQVTPGITAALKSINNSALVEISESVKIASSELSKALMSIVRSPFVEWLSTFDYSPMLRMLEGLRFDFETSERYKELNKAYLQAMYDCYWFPYAGWIADVSLFQEVNQILATSRGKSKRRTARIDKAILAYYSPKKVKEIKRNWHNSDLEPHVRKMLGHAIEAHLRGEYALTISCLATMWEGLLKAKMPTKKRNNEELKSDIKDLVSDNGYEEILSDFYNNLIVHTCYGVEDVKEGVPNRHGVAHSWYKKYPNKKASLNAILLTDFIIGLTPKEITEDNDSGQ